MRIEEEVSNLVNFNRPNKEPTKTEITLIENFDKIGFHLKITDNYKEFNIRGAKLTKGFKSFLIDLVRTKDYFYIKMFLGENSTVYVKDFDTKLNQLILYVKEPPRSFTVTMYKRVPGRRRMMSWMETITTPPVRNFLIGLDEEHPFMCILADLVDTVEQAHESLKPKEIKRLQPHEYKRQGEWFFVETNKTFPKITSQTKKGLSNGKGRPHKVSRLINLSEDAEKKIKKNKKNKKDDELKDGDDFVKKDEFYVKGVISHPDHKNVKFKNWTRVYENHELDMTTNIEGVSWVD